MWPYHICSKLSRNVNKKNKKNTQKSKQNKTNKLSNNTINRHHHIQADMDYSPSPSKVKPEFAFLDNSIEIGRAEPTSRPRSTNGLNERQRRFYAKYSDLKSPTKRKPSVLDDNSTTNSRLFRNIDSDKIPIDDNFKIQTNMIEKLIKEKKQLQTQNKEMVHIADGFKEKLAKYRNANENLKQELTKVKDQNEFLSKHQEELMKQIEELKQSKEQLVKDVETLKEQKPVEYAFNPDDTTDIFHEEPVQEPTMEDDKNETQSRIESKIDHFLNEIEFLKKLSLQNNKTNEEQESEITTTSQPKTFKEIDIIITESEELQELKRHVDDLKRKLAIREENKLRKYELKQEISELASKLESDDIPRQLKTPVDTPSKTSTPPDFNIKNGCPVCKNGDCVNQECAPSDVDVTKWY